MGYLTPGFSQEPFFKGKTVRIVVAFSAGGGFDTYSRLIARHMGKHIPGNPAIAVSMSYLHVRQRTEWRF